MHVHQGSVEHQQALASDDTRAAGGPVAPGQAMNAGMTPTGGMVGVKGGAGAVAAAWTDAALTGGWGTALPVTSLARVPPPHVSLPWCDVSLYDRHVDFERFDGDSYDVDIDAIKSGQCTLRSCVIRHIPNRFTVQIMLEEICKFLPDFEEKVVGVKLPVNGSGRCNFGYAFVHFKKAIHIVEIMEGGLEGFGWTRSVLSTKEAHVAFAREQLKLGHDRDIHGKYVSVELREQEEDKLRKQLLHGAHMLHQEQQQQQEQLNLQHQQLQQQLQQSLPPAFPYGYFHEATHARGGGGLVAGNASQSAAVLGAAHIAAGGQPLMSSNVPVSVIQPGAWSAAGATMGKIAIDGQTAAAVEAAAAAGYQFAGLSSYGPGEVCSTLPCGMGPMMAGVGDGSSSQQQQQQQQQQTQQTQQTQQEHQQPISMQPQFAPPLSWVPSSWRAYPQARGRRWCLMHPSHSG